MISRRTQTVLLVIVVGATFVLTGLWQHHDRITRATSLANQGGADSGPDRRVEETNRARALTVLRAWDQRRAAAYAAGDPMALARLYLPGSAAGVNDRRLLARYVRRGLTVDNMRTQILSVEVLAHAGDSLTLLVTDRLASAVAVSDTDRIRLPRDQANTREIELRRVSETWLVAEVRAMAAQLGENRSQPRPAESTSRTVGSANR
ncbi:MAG: hypothetical protein ACRCYU_07955 [Nocardioides sp.]